MDPSTPFAHASEAEMSRILDFYAVRWEYEPHTFPILWNLDGDVVESFAPDFYLPDLDLYLEMTTLRQRLVRKKNRKLRRLQSGRSRGAGRTPGAGRTTIQRRRSRRSPAAGRPAAGRGRCSRAARQPALTNPTARRGARTSRI